MPDFDLDAIQAAADAAMGGSWAAKNGAVVIAEDGRCVAEVSDWDDYEERKWTAEFIALCDPLTVAALVERVRQLTTDNENLAANQRVCSCVTAGPSVEGPSEDCEQHGRGHDWWVGLANKACESRAAALAQIEALQAGEEFTYLSGFGPEKSPGLTFATAETARSYAHDHPIVRRLCTPWVPVGETTE